MKVLLLVFLFFVISLELLASATLSKTKKQGFLKCGVTTGLAGFSAPDSKAISGLGQLYGL